MERLNRLLMAAVTLLAIGMIIYQMAYTQLICLPPIKHQNLHLMLAMMLVFLWSMKKAPSWVGKALAALLALLALYATTYIFVEYDDLEMLRGPIGALTGQDLIVGSLLLILSIEACRRAFGIIFPLVALLFISYGIFGHFISGPLAAPEITYPELITSYVMGFSGGLYGTTLSVSANYIFLFVVFGSFLGATGASGFFNRIGLIVGRRLAGGPAISAVVSSALVGSITGSAMANVATTGVFTIPLMKQAGYRPEQAGAIEAAASTGGQIMPPVMGATAFVLAEMAHRPYADVMAAAFLPALLYFFSVGLYAQLQAKRLGIHADRMSAGTFTTREFLLEAPLFLGPLSLIIAMLVLGFSPMFTIFWAMLILLAINATLLFYKGKLKDMPGALIPACREGAVTGAKIAVTCAVLGPIVTTITKTSLGIRVPGIIAMFCDGSLLLALFITAGVCILLGMGVPTLAAYLMVAMVGVPTLSNLGIPAFAAHMFVFIFAAFSAITPPIATAAIPAAGIAETDYMKTAMESAKVGCVGFLIPFLTIFSPELMIGQGNGIATTFMAFFWTIIAVIFLCMGTTGFFLRRLPLAERCVSLFIALSMTMTLFIRSPYTIATCCIIASMYLLREYAIYCRGKNTLPNRKAKEDI